MTFRKHFSVKQMLRDKGFYIAAAICLTALGVVGAVGFSQAFSTADSAPAAPTVPTAAPTTAPRPVGDIVTNIPDLRTTATEPPTTTVPTAAVTEPPKPQALYVLPLSNEVSKSFSDGKPAYSPTMGDWRTHNGVDFTGDKGHTVKAAADGEVTLITQDALWGAVIEIDHGFGVTTRYCGVSARDIAVGNRVQAGEIIGVLTTVPCESEEGEHLHFEVRSGERYLDPVKVVGLQVRYTGQAAKQAE